MTEDQGRNRDLDARVEAVVRELKAEIVRKGFTVKSAVDQTELNYGVVRRYFSGQRDMPVRIYLQLCGIIGANPDEVMKRASEGY